MSATKRPDLPLPEAPDEFGFCRVNFWRHPFRWIMNDPRAYWFWLGVFTAPTIIMIGLVVRWIFP